MGIAHVFLHVFYNYRGIAHIGIIKALREAGFLIFYLQFLISILYNVSTMVLFVKPISRDDFKID